MLFQLPMFFAFFIAFAFFLRLCPKALVLPYVAIASLIFYAVWYPPYVVLLVALIVMTWLLLRLVTRDRRYLKVAVLIALMPFIFFKYTDFILQTIADLTGSNAISLGILLPLGISFVTFTIISYLVDTARQNNPPAPEFWPTAVYITFFPHLIAGPILRARQVLPFLRGMSLNWAVFVPNMALFAVGMVKKVLVADPIGRFVDQSYQSHATIDAWHAAAAIFGFAVQIYCDFSAYSDMAIALAGMLGVAFPENFQSPYTAASMSELWRRWHLTLSLWLRDYVLKPLHIKLHHYGRQIAIVLTMVVSGLWHGASWNFVLWGLAHGLVVAVENASGYGRFANNTRGIVHIICVVCTFVLWTVLAVLFRSPDLTTAYNIGIASWGRGSWAQWPSEATIPVVLGICLLLFHSYDQVGKILSGAQRIPPLLLVPILVVVIVGCSLIASIRPQTFYSFDF